MNQQKVAVPCDPQSLKAFCAKVLNITGDKFRNCKRSVYNVHVWAAPKGYVFANKFEQPDSYNAIMKEYKKPIVPASVVEKNPQAMAFLKQNGCYVTDGTKIVICGTAGEMWTVKPEKLVSSYTLENGGTITAKDLSPNRWVTVKRRATETSEVGIFVPAQLFVQMQFSWGVAFLNNPNSGGHYKGDILVFPADSMGNPDYANGCSPINNSVFETTFNQSVGGWANTGYIGDEHGKAPSIAALNSLIGGATKAAVKFAHPNPICRVKIMGNTYRLYGDVELKVKQSTDFYENGKELPEVTAPFINFYDVKATIEVNGVEQPFKPKNETFDGRMLTPCDMAEEIAFAYITRSTEFEFAIDPVNENLKKYLTFWREFKTLNLGGHLVSQFIDRDWRVFSLFAATTKYLYYNYYDESVAMTIDTKEIITIIDEFVLEAMTESADAIAAGEEKILFGDLSQLVSE